MAYHTGLHLVGFLLIISSVISKPVIKENNKLPCSSNVEMCEGRPCDEMRKVEKTLEQINLLDSVRKHEMKEDLIRDLQDEDETFSDILFTQEDAEEFYDFMANTDHKRKKRKVHPKELNRRWTMPIPYKFTGKHSSSQENAIREAIKFWESQTCVRFQEVDQDQDIYVQHITFTKYRWGCASYVGKIYRAPDGDQSQMVNLEDRCFKQKGVAIHEIGHALGLWHEHQRPNIQDVLKIDTSTVPVFYHSNFVPWSKGINIDYGIPIDESSVMMYGPRFGSYTQDNVLVHNNKFYQNNLGQRVEGSFYDAKAMNFHYCNATCTNSLPQSCQHGGYQDPNNCNRCKCPDGLGGTFCESVAPSEGADCSDFIDLSSGETATINNPGFYDSTGYKDGLRCNWRIKAPEDHKVRLLFLHLKISAYNGICNNWLEIKTESKNLDHNGMRVCQTIPTDVLYSDGEEMVLTFRSLHPTSPLYSMFETYKGFQVEVKAVPKNNNINVQSISGSSSKSTSTRPTTSKKTTPTTTTTTATTTTTTQPTTTTTKPATASTTIASTTTSTAKATTTTEKPTSTTTEQSAKSASSEDSGIVWSMWQGCNECKCGGCRVQTRYRMCGDKRCTGRLFQTESRSCGNRLCTSQDKFNYYAGRLYKRQCTQTQCCGGYEPRDGVCVPK